MLHLDPSPTRNRAAAAYLLSPLGLAFLLLLQAHDVPFPRPARKPPQALRPFKYLMPPIARAADALRPGTGLGLRLPSPLLRYVAFKLSIDLHVSGGMASTGLLVNLCRFFDSLPCWVLLDSWVLAAAGRPPSACLSKDCPLILRSKATGAALRRPLGPASPHSSQADH